MSPEERERRQRRLTKYVLLAIAAAVITITMKVVAWQITGSVGLLADAAESVVNLVAAIVALIVVRWAGQPADDDHAFGHEKADYLSAGAEGTLILVAAATIAYSAIERLIHPVALDTVGLGIAITAAATVVNLVVAQLMLRAGREETSVTLQSGGQHLMTDVWTSLGVIGGVALVGASGVLRLDPVIALFVTLNIVHTGVRLVRTALAGLLDRALEPFEIERIEEVLDRFRKDGISFHALRTRRAGPRVFVELHVLVPGDWSVQQGHDVSEKIEGDLRELFDVATVFTHLEPIEDPVSFADVELDREDRSPGPALP